MQRIAASCSILTPRLGPHGRRAGWLGLTIVLGGAMVWTVASHLPLLAVPSLACAIALVAWVAAHLPVNRPRRVAANDNHAMPRAAWPRPHLRTVASPDQEFSGAGR